MGATNIKVPVDAAVGVRYAQELHRFDKDVQYADEIFGNHAASRAEDLRED